MVNVAARQGEIWWAETQQAGRRPMLIVTRSEAIPVLRSIVAAPLTRTIRDIPTEVPLGAHHGLDTDCVASFDNLQTIERAWLTERAGALNADERHQICRALAALSDC